MEGEEGAEARSGRPAGVSVGGGEDGRQRWGRGRVQTGGEGRGRWVADLDRGAVVGGGSKERERGGG